MERLRIVSGKRSKEAKAEAEQLRRDTNLLNKQIQQQKKYVDGLDKAMGGLAGKTYNDLRNEVRQLNKLMRDGTIEKGSATWREMAEHIKRCKEEMHQYEAAVERQEPVWGKFTGFLNKNWGAITQIVGAITGLSMTIRKSVQDYADMEEAMADTRKYTGLTDEAVRDLNEDLKRMDTRTPRQELNELAGAAGRLGKTSKKDILDFVEAGNMIKVALGDDLGDGAIDKVEKLAMAFGEDERMGLRGAMLATGSAINELAQNSSAQAGYLVDFTSRVAGFGKQIGLTQAQIMGFGAVMDENLLRDEMAATAFGNMLTKMQTDTAKFAQIAGQDVKDFTRLLNEDANKAIMAVADSLRSQDPQTMMKMLDDMGLDGSRAVGVLSTLADKIDDVRERQKLATEAYAEGISVGKEYATMNNTVQARLDKCKKQFQEMSIELGEKLMPVVKYTISSFSLMVKGVSAVTSFVLENKAALISGGAAIIAYTAYVNAATIATKAHTVATNIAKAATAAFNFVTKMNPIGLLIAALTAAVALFIKYRDRINGASEATSMLKQAGSKLAGVLAQVTGWFIKLVKWAIDLYNRFSFIRKIIQLMTAAFTYGFTNITIAVKFLIDELGGVATVIEGIFTLDWDKIKEGYKQGFKAVADAAKEQFNLVKRTMKETFSASPPADTKNAAAAGAAIGSAVGQAAGQQAGNELPEVTVTGKRKPSGYQSSAERKKEEQERRKREAAEKKEEAERERRLKERADAAKAALQEQMAEEMLAYRQGISTYTDYMEERHNLTQNYYDQLKRIYGEDSNEYKKALLQQEQDEQEYNSWRLKQDEDGLLREKLEREHVIRMQ